jgi:hypothetical protein
MIESSQQQQFEDFLHSTALIEVGSTIAGIQDELVEKSNSSDTQSGTSLYFGTGLCTSKAMTVGIPFDILGMLFVAEYFRRFFGLDQMVQLIADTHAKSNDFTTVEEVDTAADRLIKTMSKVAKNLGIDKHYTPILSSSFDGSDEYQAVFDSIRSDDHEYVRREWSDIEYLRQTHKLQLKLSWIVDPKAKKIGFDERLYDLRFIEITGQPMSFAYVMAGRTLDKERPKASPYICVAGENRILLEKDEQVKEKLADAKVRLSESRYQTVIDHLQSIVDLYNKLFDKDIKSTNTETAVEELIRILL